MAEQLLRRRYRYDPLNRLAWLYIEHGYQAARSGLPGFNGECPDPLTGHYLPGNGHRAFNPVLMRFNSPDHLGPFGQGGLNVYAYCQNDPVNYLDRTGCVRSRVVLRRWHPSPEPAAQRNRLPVEALVSGDPEVLASGIADRVPAVSIAPSSADRLSPSAAPSQLDKAPTATAATPSMLWRPSRSRSGPARPETSLLLSDSQRAKRALILPGVEYLKTLSPEALSKIYQHNSRQGLLISRLNPSARALHEAQKGYILNRLNAGALKISQGAFRNAKRLHGLWVRKHFDLMVTGVRTT